MGVPSSFKYENSSIMNIPRVTMCRVSCAMLIPLCGACLEKRSEGQVRESEIWPLRSCFFPARIRIDGPGFANWLEVDGKAEVVTLKVTMRVHAVIFDTNDVEQYKEVCFTSLVPHILTHCLVVPASSPYSR